jgi:hypothetical protein
VPAARRRRPEPSKLLAEGAAVARYLGDLRAFLRTPIGPDEGRASLELAFQTREERFLRLVAGAIFGQSRSPYLPLLRQAGVEHGDVEGLVLEHGLQGALERLFDAGVHVSLAEFKGYRPIQRPGLEPSPKAADFTNPLTTSGFVGASGGSRGMSRRVRVDLEVVAHEVAYDWLWIEGFVVDPDAPGALWRPAPPGGAGLKQALRAAKRGRPIERWFAQNRFVPRRRRGKDFLFAGSTLVASRLWGVRIPRPEYVPASDVLAVVRWLAAKTGAGTPATLGTPATSCVRVCLAARDSGFDISGTVFFIGGEPVTEAKAAVVAERGCRYVANYSMAETGLMGLSCARGTGPDDLHLLEDKVAVVLRERRTASGEPVDALHLTTLHPASPSVMLNVESGDTAVLGERECGCPLGSVGFRRRLSEIRSYEKLTSEGMTFVGERIVHLVEHVLPERFGGGPLDYQLVEDEQAGLTTVSVVVDPRVGDVDEAAVVETVLATLGANIGARMMMTEVWRGAGVVRVVRREPYVTAAAKVQPLHVLRRKR